MGGGDSKPEQSKVDDQKSQIKDNNVQNSPRKNINKKGNNPNFPNQQNQSSLISPTKQPFNQFNNKERGDQNFQSKQFQNISNKNFLNSNEYGEGKHDDQMEYFQHWDPMFHTQGSMKTKVLVLTMHPTPQFKNLERQESNHEGVLSWNYQSLRNKLQKQLCLRLIYQEQGRYSLNFLVNRQSVALEGDQDIWRLICPFRTQEDGLRIGGLFCERIYEQQGEEQNDQPTEFDPQLFAKWSQKILDPRINMRRLLKKKRENIKLSTNEGIRYRQISKYFNAKNEWVFSVLIEQKQNKFKCWMIESQSGMYNDMSSTIKGDIQNRQSMYIEEMKRKKKRNARKKRNKNV